MNLSRSTFGILLLILSSCSWEQRETIEQGAEFSSSSLESLYISCRLPAGMCIQEHLDEADMLLSKENCEASHYTFKVEACPESERVAVCEGEDKTVIYYQEFISDGMSLDDIRYECEIINSMKYLDHD